MAAALRLLDLAKRHGFGFWAPGSCSATRRRKSSLLVPGDLLVTGECPATR